MRRVPIWLAGLFLLLAMAACSAGGAATLPVSGHTQTYHDAGGWTIKIPPGWHAVHFSASSHGITSAGLQLSNVKLPLPSLVPRYPMQVNGRVLPARGVGLIIATDPDPGLSHGQVSKPPLPAPNGRYWTMGSAPAGSPYLETLWFRVHGTIFIASAKIGPKATSHDLNVAAAIIQSLR